MPVLHRNTRSRGTTADSTGSGEWKPEWTGRKNFKKFKRKGREVSQGDAVASRIIIGMVEHKGQDYGLGDGYWLEDEEDDRKVVIGKGRRERGDEGVNSQVTVKDTQAQEETTERRVQVAVERRRVGEKVLEVKEETPVATTGRGRARGETPVNRGKSVVPQKRGRRQMKSLESDQEDKESEEEDEEDDGLKFRFRKGRRRG